MHVVWTDYMLHRMAVRDFDQTMLEQVVRHSNERYFDTVSHRIVAIGRHHGVLVIIPYEQRDEVVTPITVHATTRQAIEFRISSGRFVSE